MNGELASSFGCSVSQVSENSDGSPRPISVRVSPLVLPRIIGMSRRLRRRIRIERIARQRAAVLDGAEIRGRAAHLDDLLHRQRAQARRSLARGRARARRAAPRRCGSAVVDAAGRDLLAALRDDAMKQAARLRHRHQRGALRAATRVAEDRHVARSRRRTRRCCRAPIRARGSDRAGRRCRSRRARAAELGQIQIAERVQPMVDGDDDDVAAAAESRAVGFDLVAGAARIGAAVEPDHHRTLARRREAPASRR